LQPVPPELKAYRDKGLENFFFFAKYILGYRKLVHRVHGPICQALQDEKRKRINFTMPRKYYKSTIASIAYPLWRATRNPNLTMLIAMNTTRNAVLKLEELKGHVERNQLYRALYPEAIPDFAHTRWGADAANLRRDTMSGTPTFQAVGATTTVISQAVDEIIMDDILTAQQDDISGEEILPGRRDIDKAIGWYKGAISLIKDPAQGRIINAGTRWAEKDLIEYVLATDHNFAANNFTLKALDKDGKATMPENYSLETLEEIRATLGSTIFHLWYLNEPIDPKEIIFPLERERHFYQPNQMHPGWLESLRVYTAVDLAFTDTEKSDNTAIVTIGVDDKNTRYVLDVQYGHFDPMDTIARLFSLYERFHPRVIGIESVSAAVLMSRFLPHFMRLKEKLYQKKGEEKAGGLSSNLSGPIYLFIPFMLTASDLTLFANFAPTSFAKSSSFAFLKSARLFMLFL